MNFSFTQWLPIALGNLFGNILMIYSRMRRNRLHSIYFSIPPSKEHFFELQKKDTEKKPFFLRLFIITKSIDSVVKLRQYPLKDLYSFVIYILSQTCNQLSNNYTRTTCTDQRFTKIAKAQWNSEPRTIKLAALCCSYCTRDG